MGSPRSCSHCGTHTGTHWPNCPNFNGSCSCHKCRIQRGIEAGSLPKGEHAHLFSSVNGIKTCEKCKREAIVCPDCNLCTLCVAGIHPDDVRGLPADERVTGNQHALMLLGFLADAETAINTVISQGVEAPVKFLLDAANSLINQAGHVIRRGQ